MATLKVGGALQLKGHYYICVRITRREETYITTMDSFTLRQAHKMNPSLKGGAAACLRFECDDFDIDDVITESIEEIRFTCVENSNPFTVINYKLYKKEKKDDEPGRDTAEETEAQPSQPQADRQGDEGEGGLRQEAPHQDGEAVHGVG